jgi:hypothetical protein
MTPFLRENGTQSFQTRLRINGLHSEEQNSIVHDKSNHTPILNLKEYQFVL